MKKAIVVPVKWDPLFNESIGTMPLYYITLDRIRRLAKPGDYLVIAASADTKTGEFIENHIKPGFPGFSITYGDENAVWERIYQSTAGLDVDVVARVSLTQPLFNAALLEEMLLFFKHRFTQADYVFQRKYPTALACDFIKKDTLARIAKQCGQKANLLAAGLPAETFKALEYIPPYDEGLADCPSDLRITTLLDLEINRGIWELSKKKYDTFSIPQAAGVIHKVLTNFKFPVKKLTAREKIAIREKFRLPISISFEVISTCILDCEFCILKDLQSWKYRRKPIMTLDEFKKIIDDIAWYTTFIDFSGGEPLLHKDIFAMCAYAREQGIYTIISSNTQLLSRGDNLEKLLESPPDEIVIAFDALEKETYETIRRKGSYEELVRNITNLVRLKKERNAVLPLVTMQMVLTKKNRHMKEDFWKTAAQFGVDRAAIKPIGLWPEANPAYDKKMAREYIVPRNEEGIARHDIRDGKPVFIRWPGQCPCAGLSYIGSGGEVIPCYYIIAKTRVMGNAVDKGFFQVWNSKRYRAYRDKMLHSWANPLCHRCIGIGTDIETRDFSRENKR